MGRIERRLRELGLVIPEAAKPVANYVPFAKMGTQVFVAGQLPFLNGKLIQTGKLGGDVSVAQGAAAARQCAINIISQLRASCDGNLDRIVSVCKLVGFVNCQNDFVEIPQVVNGASDLIVDVFGEAGIHARSSVGVTSLPLNSCVEIEAVAEIER